MAQPAGKQDAQREVDRLRNFRSCRSRIKMFWNSHSNSGTSLNAYLDGLFANLSKRFEIDVTDSQK